MSEARADALAVIAAESDQLTAAFRERHKLPVVGVAKMHTRHR